MAAVRAVATRWLSHDFPGFLEVELTDVRGSCTPSTKRCRC